MHTWLGIGLVSVTFIIFWMGTLSVFTDEIDQWMIPEKRITFTGYISLDETAKPFLEEVYGETGLGSLIILPTKREPTLRVFYFENGEFVGSHLHPETGEPLSLLDTKAASEFLYPMHYTLHLHWNEIGEWIVGVATFSMILLVVSGTIIHQKLISDFFTFRPKKALRRSTLDLHNLSGVIGIPFMLLICVSGLLLADDVYIPYPLDVIYKDDTAQIALNRGEFMRPATGEFVQSSISLDAFRKKAEKMWNEGRQGDRLIRADQVGWVHIGDAEEFVSIRSTVSPHMVPLVQGWTYYDSQSEEIIFGYEQLKFMNSISWLRGAHVLQFDHVVLRWLYFFAGILGCIVIATGAIFWMKKRENNPAMRPVQMQAVRAIIIASTTGVIAATGAFLVINRILPSSFTIGAFDRSEAEVLTFFSVWALSLLHASVRDKAAWADQCIAIAAFAGVATLLNWVTTGDHIVAAGAQGLWSVAGMDFMLLATALVAALSVFRLRRTQLVLQASKGEAQTRARTPAK